MRNIKYIIFSLILLSNCSVVRLNSIEKDKVDRRIKLKEVTIIRGEDEGIKLLSWYQIIEVDEHEYLVSIDGGMIHLESCRCKKIK